MLRRRWPLMVLIVLAALVASYSITPRTHRYVSETTLLLGQAPTNLDEGSTEVDGSRLTGLSFVALTYIEMIKSLPVAEGTINEFGLNVSPKSLADAVTAVNVPGTQLIDVRVTDDDPETARQLADATVQSFIRLLEDQSDQQRASGVTESATELAPVSVFAPASLPTTPLDNGLFQNLLLALLFGVFVAVGVIMVLEYVDLTLRMPEDVERHTGLPVLGVIPMSQELTNRSVIIGAASRFVQSRGQL